MLHLILAALRARVWWEYVESHANWSDRLSRELSDPWLVEQGFEIRESQLGTWPWAVDEAQRWQHACAVVAALGVKAQRWGVDPVAAEVRRGAG